MSYNKNSKKLNEKYKNKIQIKKEEAGVEPIIAYGSNVNKLDGVYGDYEKEEPKKIPFLIKKEIN